MEEDMMNMQVDPVMQPEQMMMQGTPAPQGLPMELQQEMDQIAEPDQEEAKQALMQIIQILQQMVSQGASEEEIQAFLEQVGITMEELEMAREMFGI
jgi:hypothetical protein